MMRLKNFTDNKIKGQKAAGAAWRKEIPGFLLVAAAFVLTGFLCPLVFSLNDDAMMRSILSGSYTGTPDGHAVYMKYPLTGILSLLYRVSRAVPWFTLFFAGSMAVCVFIILKLTGKNIRSRLLRTAGILLAAELIVLLLWRHYVVMHYTIAAALIGGTAVLLMAEGGSEKSLSKSGTAGSLCLLYLCYMVRSQVFFLTLPFLLAAAAWDVFQVPVWKTIKNKLCAWARYAGIFLAGFLLLAGINRLMYGSDAWQHYLAYNEARTQLYDYTVILPYEKYEDIYKEAGITKEQYRLLEEYGTVLDQELDARALDMLARKTEEIHAWNNPWKELFKDRFQEYYYRSLHGNDFPYNAVVLFLYVAAAAGCLLSKQWCRLGLLVLTGLGRSCIWLYLMMQGRYPERVTVSLYLIETLLLAGICLQFLGGYAAGRHKEKEKFLWKTGYTAGLLGAAALALLPCVWTEVQKGISRAEAQQQCQEEWEPLKEYMLEREDSFFYVDVYSVVVVSGMQYEAAGYENYMLLGGWMTRHALQQDKQDSTGYASAAEALARGENIYLVTAHDRYPQWIEEYLRSLGYDTKFRLYEETGGYHIYTALQEQTQ